MIRKLVLAAAAILMCALPARATSIAIGGLVVNDQGQFSSVAGATTVDFNAVALGNQNFVTGIATYQANIFSCACSGIGDLLDDTTKGARGLVGAPLTIDFSQPISYFGLYWGSPDPGNTITFFNGATQLLAFTGANLGAMGVGFGISNAAYVNFTAGIGESYTRVVLSSTDFPFETDNHSYFQAVPEPTSLALLGTGALGLLAKMRRRRKQPAQA